MVLPGLAHTSRVGKEIRKDTTCYQNLVITSSSLHSPSSVGHTICSSLYRRGSISFIHKANPWYLNIASSRDVCGVMIIKFDLRVVAGEVRDLVSNNMSICHINTLERTKDESKAKISS